MPKLLHILWTKTLTPSLTWCAHMFTYEIQEDLTQSTKETIKEFNDLGIRTRLAFTNDLDQCCPI